MTVEIGLFIWLFDGDQKKKESDPQVEALGSIPDLLRYLQIVGFYSPAFLIIKSYALVLWSKALCK